MRTALILAASAATSFALRLEQIEEPVLSQVASLLDQTSDDNSTGTNSTITGDEEETPQQNP